MNVPEVPFLFLEQAEPGDFGDAVVVQLPAKVRSKGELLELLGSHLSFPSYFGRNWDALLDCLSDLNWLGHKRVVIAHEGIPAGLPVGQTVTYLQVLTYALERWAQRAEQRLVVTFPERYREDVARLLQE